MTGLKKIIALLLGVSVIFSAVYAYTDVTPENRYYSSISKLEAFGIMNGYADGTFGAEEIVSRAEATVILTRLLQLTPDYTKNSFRDVESGHWAKGEIEAAASAGLVSGVSESVFRPDNGLTKYQAIVLLLNAIGYKPVAMETGGHPTGYLSIAAKKKLLSGIDYSENAEIKRGELAHMICNALECSILVGNVSSTGVEYNENTDMTLLSEYLDAKITRGQVTANEMTGLSSAADCVGMGEVRIGNVIYNTGGTNLWRMLGHHVKVYWREDDSESRTVLFYEEQTGHSSLTVDSEDIDRFENNILYYYKDGGDDLKEAAVSEIADEIFNGRYKVLSRADFIPEIGSLELYDADGDGIYDVVNMRSYATYVVSSAEASSQKIFDKLGQTALDLKNALENKRVSMEYNGAYIGIADIAEGDVLSVAADVMNFDLGYATVDKSSEIYEIIVCRDRINGAVDRVSKDGVNIGGIDYKTSGVYANAESRGKVSAITLGSEGEFCLDVFGRLAYYSSDSAMSADGNYAYLICAGAEDKLIEGRTMLKVFDFALNGVTDFTCASSVRIDKTVRKTSDEILSALKTQYNGSVSANIIPRLIVYKKNADGEINVIDTDYVSSAEDSLTSLRYDDNYAKRNYSNGIFGGDIAVTADTKVLSVPYKSATAANGLLISGSSRTVSLDPAKADYIYLRKGTSFSSSSTSMQQVETYNIKNNGEAEMLIYYYYPKTAPADVTKATLTYQITDTIMIDEVNKCMVGDENGYEITGVCGNTVKTLFLKDTLSKVMDVGLDNDGNSKYTAEINPHALNRGDIVRYRDNIENTNITPCIERLVKAGDESALGSAYFAQSNSDSTLSKTPYYYAFTVASGTMMSNAGGFAKLDFSAVLDGSDCAVYNLGENIVTMYDYSNDSVSVVSNSELTGYDDTNDREKTYRTVIVSTNGAIKAIYAYRD